MGHITKIASPAPAITVARLATHSETEAAINSPARFNNQFITFSS
jgi:hypothetical protein